MNIDLFSYTNEGARELNEDSYGVQNNAKRCVAVLCDGLGGHNCGEVASQAAVRFIMDGIARLTDLSGENIQDVIRKVNDAIVEQQENDPACQGMRTTTVGCVFENDKLTYFNCGDSRFYYFSNGMMTAMSKDHSVSQMSVELGEMDFDSIRFDADRNKLLKVLGESVDKELATVYPPILCKPGDAFLLCSDGFWEYVLEDEMEIDLAKSQTAEEWIKFMLVRLLLKFSDKNDNFTVVGGIVR